MSRSKYSLPPRPLYAAGKEPAPMTDTTRDEQQKGHREAHGQGGAMSETEELRERVRLLEEQAKFAAVPQPASPQKMVRIMGGVDAWAPYYGPGEPTDRPPVEPMPYPPPPQTGPIRIAPNSFVGREIAWRQQTGQFVDTRSAELVRGPETNISTNRLVDHVAAGFDAIDQAEARRRYFAARPFMPKADEGGTSISGDDAGDKGDE
jgi:hypothetical protein